MSEHRNLLIENPASLSVNLGRLRIRREGHDDSYVLPRDIAVLCLHHHTIQISVQALRALAEAGTSVIITDKIHHPCAWLLPQVGNGDLVRRLRQQIALDNSPVKDQLWQAIVRARLMSQAANLRVLNHKGALRLERLAKAVQPADPTQCEGQGSKHYWNCLFDDGFKREKQGAEDAAQLRLCGNARYDRPLARDGWTNPCLRIGALQHGKPL